MQWIGLCRAAWGTPGLTEFAHYTIFAGCDKRDSRRAFDFDFSFKCGTISPRYPWGSEVA